MHEEISFGVWLRKQRRVLDLSRQAFADQVGCAEVTLRRIEAGTLKPSKELVSILLEKLGIPEAERPQWISFARGLSGFPFSSTAQLNRSITNLPAPLTTFIGREKEQADVMRLIAKHRLVTLTGSGGVGKTRLAIKVGKEVVEDYADGVWLVELASLNDPMFLPKTVATLFGLVTQSDISPLDLLINFLRAKSALLILDNCEHLVDACAHLADTLLKNCPNLKILVTSREPLEIAGEALYRVPSLRLPDLQYQFSTLRNIESVSLFEERAQLVQFDFSLTPQNASSIVQICHRLDGIPLAIELAAAKVTMFSTEQIAKQLHDSITLLTGGSRTAPPRHQTVRAAIDWSFTLLSQPEQLFFSRLAVFTGGFTLNAAEKIAIDRSISKGQIIHLLGQLINKSLVTVRARAEKPNSEHRYGMLETIRAYGLEKLNEFGETQRVRQGHRDFFIAFAEQAEPKLKGPQQLEWLDRLEVELDNFRAVLKWTYEVGDVKAMSRLAELLFWFWKQRGYLREGRAWLERALEVDATPTRSGRATLFYQVASLAREQGDFAGARKFVEESIVLWRSLASGEKQELPLALALLSWLVRDAGDPGTARFLAEEGVALSRQQGNAWNLAFSLISLGMAFRDQENYNLAQSIIEESRRIWQELGDLWGLAQALYYLGLVAYRRGDYELAYSLIEDALDIRLQLGDKQKIAYSLHELGVLTLAQGNPDGARPFFEQDLVLFRDLGDKSGIALSLQYHGLFAHLQGDDALSQASFEEGLRLAWETGPLWLSSNYLLWLADVASGQGQLERAVQLCSAADTHIDKIRSFWDAFEYSHYNRIMNLARASLSQTAFAQVEAEGRSMTIEQAVALALETMEEM